MSGSTWGGVIGAVVGTFIPGVGPQLGWMIGSAIGGYIDPMQIEGPRLGDARVQTSRDGVPIPFGWGTFPNAGNVIWQAPPIKHTKTERQGKGGPEVKTEYWTRSYAIGVCEGEITGFLQIYRNKKLVYDARDDATLEEEYSRFGLIGAAAFERITGQRAEDAKFKNKCAMYTGIETQDPDPTIESYLGVDNVPAYRGVAYIVVTDDDSLDGEIAQYDFVVSKCGDVVTVPGGAGAEWIIGFDGSPSVELSPNGIDWSTAGFMPSPAWSPDGLSYAATNGDSVLLVTVAPAIGTTGVFSTDRGATWSACSGISISSNGGECLFSGGYWHIGDTVHDVQRSADGVTFAAVATAAPAHSIAVFEDQLYGIGLGQNIYKADISGNVWAADSPSTITGSASLETSRMFSSPVELGVAGNERGTFGGTGIDNDRRCHIYSKSSGTWTEHANPFADAIDTSPTPACLHYSVALGIWVVAFNKRIAYGPSLSSLTLSAHVFSDYVLNIDSDQAKIIVCGQGGVLDWSPDGDDWSPLSPGPVVPIYTVAAFWQPNTSISIPDSPGSFTTPGGAISVPAYDVIEPCVPFLYEIVADICEREGLTSDEYDVSQLTDLVPGFVVARETDGASIIGSLSIAYFFDSAEWDGKLRFVKRGGTAVGSINWDDLVERGDGEPLERERVQELELLWRATIGYIDRVANYGPTTQKYERRAGTVRARGEASFEVPVNMETNDAATVTKRRVLIAWGEPEKQKLSLPYRLTAYTPTDILNVTDPDADVFPIRLMNFEDDSGVRRIESSDNCAEAYGAVANGVSPKPPTIVDTKLLGPTILEAMNLSSLRLQDNVPGMYFAACGVLPGWPGCIVEMSKDLGTTFEPIATITDPATMGYITASIGTSTEPIPIFLYAGGSMATITVAQMTAGVNASAILTNDIAEIVQPETVTALGNGAFDLTDIVRGVGDTSPASHTYGDSFVLLDYAVIFVPIDISLSGQTLVFRGVTQGTSSDSASSFSVVYEPPTFVLDGGEIT